MTDCKEANGVRSTEGSLHGQGTHIGVDVAGLAIAAGQDAGHARAGARLAVGRRRLRGYAWHGWS